MPPLDDKDREEIKKLIPTALGVPEGKTFAEFLAEDGESRTNAILNKYDKRQSKDREELKKTLGEFATSLKELKEAPPDDPDPEKDPEKKPPAESPEMKRLQNEMRKVRAELEASQKERADEKAAREKLEQSQAHSALIDAVRTKALSKDIGVDPDKLPFLISHFDHNGAVRLNEGKTGYEITIAKDKAGEPIWETLDEGLAKFVKSGPGAFFMPPVKGAGGGTGSGGGKPGAGSGSGAEPTKSVDLIKAGLEKRAAGQ